MEVVQLDQMEDGTPVYCDRQAYESDGIIIFNKVKPHTDFRGKWESGLAKMCAIGISKHQGASYFHMKGFPSFARRVPEVARILIDRAPVIFGLGVVQNAYDEISELDAMPRERIMERDAALLEIAKAKIASFKMHSMDVLIIDRTARTTGNAMTPTSPAQQLKGFEDVLDCRSCSSAA